MNHLPGARPRSIAGALRRVRGLTRAQLAARLGVHEVTLARYELRTRPTPEPLLAAWAAALRVPVRELAPWVAVSRRSRPDRG